MKAILVYDDNDPNVQVEVLAIKSLLQAKEVPFSEARFERPVPALLTGGVLKTFLSLMVEWNQRVASTARVFLGRPALLIYEDQLLGKHPDYGFVGGADGIRTYFDDMNRGFLISRLQGKGYKGN